MEFANSRGGGFRDFRLSLSWVVGKIRGGGVVDKVSKFEGGGRIRRISSDFMGYPNPRGPGMRSGGPTVGPGGARARAREGGQDWGQGGQGWGQGGPWPPWPPAGYGPAWVRFEAGTSRFTIPMRYLRHHDKLNIRLTGQWRRQLKKSGGLPSKQCFFVSEQ